MPAPWRLARAGIQVRAINRVGLVRRGVPEQSRQAIKQAFKTLFMSHEPRAKAIEQVHAVDGEDPYVARLVDFVRASLRRERQRAGK